MKKKAGKTKRAVKTMRVLWRLLDDAVGYTVAKASWRERWRVCVNCGAWQGEKWQTGNLYKGREHSLCLCFASELFRAV